MSVLLMAVGVATTVYRHQTNLVKHIRLVPQIPAIILECRYGPRGQDCSVSSCIVF
ncbi:hypothetical protein DSUL_90077 [Desulfovibrionales bacterium]